MVFLKCTLKSKKLSHSLFEFFRFFDYLSYFRWLYEPFKLKEQARLACVFDYR